MTAPINVLVVDDSTFIRKAIIRILSGDPELHVVGQARDGEEALRLLGELPVDVMTLDMEMPGCDGLELLRRLDDHRRVPVVVFSSTTSAGASNTLEAFELGAFDVVTKPQGGPLDLFQTVSEELLGKVRAASKARRRRPAPVAPPAPRRLPPATSIEAVLIGISTGGPPALQQVIPALPADFPLPVVVLQHMPPGFTRALADRLGRLSALAVKEAEEGDWLLPGRVLVAPAGKQMSFARSDRGTRVVLLDECPFASFYRPSIDFAFQEAARAFEGRLLGVVMTGMGADGAAGLQAIKRAGGLGWAQDEATSVIYGMPRAAAEAGAVDEIIPLDRLAARLVESFAGGRK